jgi:hypothetical protein
VPVDISGHRHFILSRNQVSAADTAAPTGNNGTLQGANTAVEIPLSAKGGITHVLVYIDGSASDAAAIVSVYGLLDESNALSSDPSNLFAGKWFALWQLNSGAAISGTTKSAFVASGNDVLFAQSLGHVSLYRKLTAVVTGFTSVSSISIAFIFEEP